MFKSSLCSPAIFFCFSCCLIFHTLCHEWTAWHTGGMDGYREHPSPKGKLRSSHTQLPHLCMFSISLNGFLSRVEDDFAKNLARGDLGNDLWLESPKNASPAVQAACFILVSVSYSSHYIHIFEKAVC